MRTWILVGLMVGAAGVAQALAALGGHAELIEKLRLALAPELPPSTKDGGFIAKGFAPPLDEFGNSTRGVHFFKQYN